MEQTRRVVVVGAGASGMAAAIAAAVSGASVCLLEAHAKPGRTVMASGNGRCNFANADLAPERYNDPAFVSRVMGDDPLGRILDFFEHLGLWWSSDGEGRLYPRSRAAASVLDALTGALARAGVDMRLGTRVVGLERRGGIWAVRCDGLTDVPADAVVWAAGGGTAEIPVRDAGLPGVAERPVLCPLALDPRPPKSLDGVRIACAVELRSGKTRVDRSEGEVLFRPYGISGIVVFDLSRIALPGDTVALDMLPDVGEDHLRAILARRCDERGGELGTPSGRLTFLDGALHPKLARCLMAGVCGEDGRRTLDGRAIGRLAQTLKSWEFGVAGTADESHAQVTRGGLALDAFDPMSLAARGCGGLYACGEALDVDGACGGYNLAWAWVSGMVAGVAAARGTEAAQTC